uniref:Uncharacterized protein n=1 Tax=Ciona savignyi TaxID=51511 RepID=H2YH49_CIOSA
MMNKAIFLLLCAAVVLAAIADGDICCSLHLPCCHG